MTTHRPLSRVQLRVLRHAVENGWVRPFPVVLPTVAVLALERRGLIAEAPEYEGQVADMPYRPTDAGRDLLARRDSLDG